MSTKTSIKRIAAVAAVALTFGGFSAVSANAVAAVGTTSASFALNASSITTVDTLGSGGSYALFELSLSDNKGYGTPLHTGESLTATVVANPQPTLPGGAATANSDITLAWATTANTDLTTGASSASATAGAKTLAAATTGSVFDLSLAASKRGGTNTSTDYTSTTAGQTATYALKVQNASGKAVDQGTYTIRLDLLDPSGNALQSTTVKYTVVSTKLTSGAVLTTTVTGSQSAGAALATSATQNITVAIADANGGAIREGANGYATISGSVVDATPHTADALTLADTGATDGTTAALDGVYVATGTLTNSVTPGTATVTVRYGAASSTASLVLSGATAGNYANTSVSATGQVSTNTTDYIVPLTTTSATVSIKVVNNTDASASAAAAVPGAVVYYTVGYSSGCVLGDMTPTKVSSPAKAVVDASGNYSVAITNANPLNGCSATVTFTGATANTVNAAGTGSNISLTRVINWQKATPTSALVSPAGDYTALLGSTNKVTYTVLDQFSNPVVGSTVTFALAGAN